MRYIKIPMDRIGVVIGCNGENKEKLEKISKIIINIDSKLGEISLNDQYSDNPLEIIKIENIILAIGRGFSPEKAFLLLNDDFEFFVFDIRDYVGNKDTHIQRLKSRIIGRKGKTKRIIQDLTDSDISIYGHKIAIISNFENIHIVKKAIDKLLSGSMHATVYRFVETNMKKIRLKSNY